MKLMIGVPTFGAPDPAFSMNSLPQLTYHIGRRHPEIEECTLFPEPRTYRHHARQAIASTFVASEYDYLLMLDDDMTFTPQLFDILWAHNEHPVVSGLYFTRTLPPVPCMFNFGEQGSEPILDYPKDSLMEVEIVGFGFILFHREVFLRTQPPHFQIGSWMGEDVAFGVKCQTAGIPILVHTEAVVGHLPAKRAPITEETYKFFREEVRLREEAKIGALQWREEKRDPKGTPEPSILQKAEVEAIYHDAVKRAKERRKRDEDAGGRSEPSGELVGGPRRP